MPKASIVVPVYNIKDYLGKCVASILAQTERDFELLLVDDGSTDGSGALCDDLAGQDPRIRVIHQENQGPGSARNTGIRAAVGKWLLQVDGDDWIDPDALEKTLEAGEREDADLVVFCIRTVDSQGRELAVLTENAEKNKGLKPREHRELLLTAPSAPNKLYRRDLFQRAGAEYPARKWYEDACVTPKLIANASVMVFLDYAGYNYLQRTGSTMHSSDIGRNAEILDAFDSIFSYFQEKGLFEEYRDELCFLAFTHIFMDASMRVLRMDRKHPLIPRFAAYVKEKFPDYRQNKYMARLTRNQKIILSLLEKKQYFLIDLIFKIKG